MGLAPGTRLGPYEVVSPLGAGGMGEVYRARDTRLGRDVAVKVLPDDLAANPKALARFESEARAVAALSHPNILALHDVGESGGVRYAVTELLEGETLRALVTRGAVSVKRALEIAQQAADGLAAAHEKGIVHRDLKPENVFLTKDGRTKLLDFGLAAIRSVPSAAGSDTRSPTAAVLTETGAVVGTVAYMSPEQARGEAFDFRTDQFSLGIVLYEMLTGRRPFKGISAVDLLAAIVRDEPEPLPKAAPHVPAPVCWIVERLLAKEPDARYDGTRDLARDLRTWSLHCSETGTSSGSARAAEAARRSWRNLPGALAAALVATAVLGAALATGLVLAGRVRPPSPVTRLEIRLPEGHYLARNRRPFALSRDGSLVVFSASTWKKPWEEMNQPKLFLHPLDSFEAQPIPGTEGGTQPILSPDGRHVAFTVWSEKGTVLKRVPVAGGPAVTICKCEALFGAAWSPDGSILFAAEEGPLQRVSDTGGNPEPATKLDTEEGEVSHRLPHLLPDGRGVVYTALRWETGDRAWKRARIFAQRLGGEERHLLAENGSDGRWAPPGHLVFAREATLFAAPFDARALRLGGTPVPFLQGVSHSIWAGSNLRETGAAMMDLSGSRLFAWIPGSITPEGEESLVWVDASGKETPVDFPKGPLFGARVSVDGARLLVQYYYPFKQPELLEIARGSRRNATFETDPSSVIWGPGPDRVTIVSPDEGLKKSIFSRKIDAGPGEIEPLWKSPGRDFVYLGSWSRDGKLLAFTADGAKTGADIWLFEPGRGARPFVAGRFSETSPEISPDGRWLLYASDESGRTEAFVTPLSGEGSPRMVSVGGGEGPLWSRDGSAIFYLGRTPPSAGQPGGAPALFRVGVKAGEGGLAFGLPEKLFEADYGCTYDEAPDGRFVFVKELGGAERRAWLEKILVDRIRIDQGGLPALLEAAEHKK